MTDTRKKTRESREPAVLSVRVQPRASRNEAAVQPDGSLRIRLTAPPVDNAANEALIRFLADTFDVGRSQIEIISGHTGRQKIVRIRSMALEDVKRVLNAGSK